MTSARTPQEIFGHHGSALGAEDVEDIVSDYADDGVPRTLKETSM